MTYSCPIKNAFELRGMISIFASKQVNVAKKRGFSFTILFILDYIILYFPFCTTSEQETMSSFRLALIRILNKKRLAVTLSFLKYFYSSANK